MAASSGYCELLNCYDHRAELIKLSSAQMRDIKVNFAGHILIHLKKDDVVPSMERFDRSVVDVADISDTRV